jgi:hypothetical protein
MLKACASLAFFVWTNELLPLDILLLALADRDDDPHALRIVVCTYIFISTPITTSLSINRKISIEWD